MGRKEQVKVGREKENNQEGKKVTREEERREKRMDGWMDTKEEGEEGNDMRAPNQMKGK